MEPRMYVVQEPAFLFRDRVRNIPTYLPIMLPDFFIVEVFEEDICYERDQNLYLLTPGG